MFTIKLNVSLDQESIRLLIYLFFSSPTSLWKFVISDPGFSSCVIDAFISTGEKVQVEKITRLVSVAFCGLTQGLLLFSHINRLTLRERFIGTILISRCFCKHKNRFKTWMVSRIISMSHTSLAVLFTLIYLLSCWVHSLQDWLLADYHNIMDFTCSK